jgi:hypothetical protein
VRQKSMSQRSNPGEMGSESCLSDFVRSKRLGLFSLSPHGIELSPLEIAPARTNSFPIRADVSGALSTGLRDGAVGFCATLRASPVPATRKRGKCMSRRAGQDPSVRKRFNRSKNVEEYYFQYWIDVPARKNAREKQK